MEKKELLHLLQQVEKLAHGSKWKRLFKRPVPYVIAILHRVLVFPIQKKSLKKACMTFWGKKMHILLPSSTDIYLTGGKSHDSEIRLAKFLIHTLNQGDTFIDVGTHYGYFSLLAHQLVGPKGKVLSFEASPENFKMLRENARHCKAMETVHAVVSDHEGQYTFYEFPNLYSEYNTLDISQFENEPWLKNNPPVTHDLPGIRLDSFLKEKSIKPDCIKIDVEGAEYMVVKGLEEVLDHQEPVLVLEFLSEKRGNHQHHKAKEWLGKKAYRPFVINEAGSLKEVPNIEAHLAKQRLDSDNIVFRKV
jgi:FkbM family methyltransferase